MKSLLKGIVVGMLLLGCFSAYGQETLSTQQFRREFLEYINNARQKGCTCGVNDMAPAPPLVWNNYLELAAMGHAKDMARQNYFSHTSKNGQNIEDRIVLAGYIFKGYKSFAIGENIAMGQQSIAEVMQGWFKSEGHCRNLMNPQFKEIGIAEVDHYWVQDFGGRVPFSAEQQKLIKSGKYHLIEKDNNRM